VTGDHPLRVNARPISAARFEEFGEVLGPLAALASERSEAVTSWAALARTRWGPDLEINVVPKLSRERAYDTMEVHPASGQVSVGFESGLVVVVFRPPEPDGSLTERDVIAFEVPKGCGILIRQGVWHCGLRALEGDTAALAVFRAGTSANTNVRPTPLPIEVVQKVARAGT